MFKFTHYGVDVSWNGGAIFNVKGGSRFYIRGIKSRGAASEAARLMVNGWTATNINFLVAL